MTYRSLRSLLMLAAAMCAAGAVHADDVHLDDSYGDAFLNYQPYVVPEKKKEIPPPAPKASAKPTPPAPAKEQKVDVEFLRKNYELLEEKAVNDPTTDNVKAYLYVKRITMDKAQRFSEKVTEVTNEDPLLNENNRVPYASTGAQAIRNANKLAEGEAVRELSKVGGLVVFVDGACRFCAMQMPVKIGRAHV